MTKAAPAAPYSTRLPAPLSLTQHCCNAAVRTCPKLTEDCIACSGRSDNEQSFVCIVEYIGSMCACVRAFVPSRQVGQSTIVRGREHEGKEARQ